MKIWQRAVSMAEQTPDQRNRYVDLLRALSIIAVVLGHWIMAAPSFQSNSAHMQHLLDVQPWSRWLTWVFQVMPVFFFVGGFSNGVSWESAKQKSLSYGAWLDSRIRRLLGPTIPLIILWVILAIVGSLTNVHPQFISVGSQVSLVPVWFLAIYFVIVLLVPITRYAWHRFGFASIVVPLVLAVLGDWIFFNTPFTWFGWFNYLFIWGAVHQFGYAWQQAKTPKLLGSLVMSGIGLLSLICLTKYGSYPLSLVGVPSQELSNTTPPKLPLLALAAAQIGLLLAFERPVRTWLSRKRPWALTVMVNGFIMPVFLWHSTVMMLLIALSFWLSPSLLLALPGSADWWAVRPVWVFFYLLMMLVFLPLFVWSEKAVSAGQRCPKSVGLCLFGALLISVGLALLAAGGVVGDGWLGVNWLACSLPPLGWAIVTLTSSPKR